MMHKNDEKAARKTLRNNRIEEVQSETSTRHSRRHRSQSSDIETPRRPTLTERNLTAVSEASVSTSRRSSRHGNERSPRSPHSLRSPIVYKAPFFENAAISRPDLARRHTDSLPREPTSSRAIYAPPQRTMSSPNIGDDIDMHLAYGDIHPDNLVTRRSPTSGGKEAELKGLMTKLDKIMLEAHCVQHSAATIIATLQANPEAMAAVALTLAEISNLVSKMSPGVLAALKGGSPAIFALLASPQFLIAGGVAVGVTIVMFGGYKIIKKIRADAAEKEASRMDEALVYEGDLGSIESWRRGIADEEAKSMATSVDGEFITPEAARVRKEKIRERAREERSRSVAASSERTVRRKDVPSKVAEMRTVISESVKSESTVKPRKEVKESKEKKVKKSSALTILFKKSVKSEKDKASTARSKSMESHKPKLLEL